MFMNLKKLEQQIATNLKLRAFPVEVVADGQESPILDEEWRLDSILAQPSRVVLTNVQRGLTLELQTDNVREFRSPHFLLLRCQLRISGNEIHLEPHHDFNETFSRLEIQMPALLDEMRKDLRSCPLRREMVVLQKSWSYWAKGNEFSYYTEDHPQLLSQLQILSNQGLASNITYNNVTRYLMSEELARYLGA
jgi:hypothetical protein